MQKSAQKCEKIVCAKSSSKLHVVLYQKSVEKVCKITFYNIQVVCWVIYNTKSYYIQLESNFPSEWSMNNFPVYYSLILDTFR